MKTLHKSPYIFLSPCKLFRPVHSRNRCKASVLKLIYCIAHDCITYEKLRLNERKKKDTLPEDRKSYKESVSYSAIHMILKFKEPPDYALCQNNTHSSENKA